MTPAAKPCTFCYGFGVWPDGCDEFSPVSEDEAKDTGYPTLPCPLCQSINSFVIDKYGLVDESEMPGPFKPENSAPKASDFLTSLKKFEERIRCAESSGSQDMTLGASMPW